MRSLFEKKPWILLASILALAALTVLSVSLRNVIFNEAQPVTWQEAEPSNLPSRPAVEQLHEVSVQSQILFWVILAVLVVLIGVLLSPETRKKLIRIFIRVAATYWGLYYLFKTYPEILSVFNLDLWSNAAAGQGDTAASVPSPVFTPPQEVPWLSYLVSLSIVLGAMFLLWKLYGTWRGVGQSSRTSPLQEVARIARSSLQELSSGRDATDVIMRCYFRMSDVVADKRNLQRGLAMTPAEFAIRLEQAGLPGEAVQSLTRLFEGVRYGKRKAEPRDVNEAVACLTNILQHCGETV